MPNLKAIVRYDSCFESSFFPIISSSEYEYRFGIFLEYVKILFSHKELKIALLVDKSIFAKFQLYFKN